MDSGKKRREMKHPRAFLVRFAHVKLAGSEARLTDKAGFPSENHGSVFFLSALILLPPDSFARVKPLAASRPCETVLCQCARSVKKKKIFGEVR